MFPIPPVLFKFPMIGVHSSVDIYSIFRFEPMHNFSLGISKLLKECGVTLLKDEERESSAMKTCNGYPRKFKNIKNSVLSMLNGFLHAVQISSAGYGLRVDFSKEGTTGRLSGFFNENGLIGMIEASEYDSIDMVSPFLGAIIDRCCGNYKAEVTIAFTRYVDLVNDIFRRFKRPGWKEEELVELSEKIKYFKNHSYNTFNMYQPSRMGTGKWHSLDHIVDDLRAVGSVSYLHVGLFENYHKRVKEEYRLTSKRSETAMGETVKRQNLFISNGKSRCESKHIPSPRPNPSRVEASRSDSGVLVRSGKRTSLNDLELMASEMHTKKNSSGNIFSPSICAKRISSTIKEDGMSSLISLLHEKYETLGIDINVARHIDIQNPASAYISGYNPPSLSNDIIEDVVLVPKSSYRILQHVVSMDNYHGTKNNRRDFVMVEGFKDEGIGLGSDKMPVWFAQILTFLRICDAGPENSQCETHKRRACPECNLALDKELRFVQFFDVIREDELKIDEIDKELNCIRLKWQRNEGEDGKYKSSRQFGLLPVDSLRGIVHIVPADTTYSVISKTELRRVQYDGIGKGEEGWPSSVFYVNRFYRSIGTVLDHEEEER